MQRQTQTNSVEPSCKTGRKCTDLLNDHQVLVESSSMCMVRLIVDIESAWIKMRSGRLDRPACDPTALSARRSKLDQFFRSVTLSFLPSSPGTILDFTNSETAMSTATTRVIPDWLRISQPLFESIYATLSEREATRRDHAAACLAVARGRQLPAGFTLLTGYSTSVGSSKENLSKNRYVFSRSQSS